MGEGVLPSMWAESCGGTMPGVYGGTGRSKWGEQGGAGRPAGWEVTRGFVQCCLPCSLVLSAELRATGKETSLQSTLDLTEDVGGKAGGSGMYNKPPQM